MVFDRSLRGSGRLELIAGFRVGLVSWRSSEKFDDFASTGRRLKVKCTMQWTMQSIMVFDGSFKESGTVELLAGFRFDLGYENAQRNY